LALLFALFLVLCRCKRGTKTEDANILAEEGLSLLLNKVLAATDNLDDKYIIGRGAHGVVYRASLGSGEEYAVKKLIFAEHIRANQNMKREIETIGLVRHRNLIRLERFWRRKEDGLMLYQYMPNGSLHDVLHRGNQGEAVLDWSARFNIALGISHGLAYLHHDCHPPIIHRDIKPENILMDSDMEPHIGDFGLARILDDSTVSTATVTGTTGYIAPENAYKTVRSKESDVYSYGVVLLELVTGKRALDRSFPEDINIVSWVRSVLSSYEDEDDTAGPIVDPKLVDELLDTKLREQAIQVTDLALRCTDKRPENRPSMRDVVKDLTDLESFVRSTSGSVH
jgi:serine/threonine protein kinase